MLREPNETFIPEEAIEPAPRAGLDLPALRERRATIPRLARRLLAEIREETRNDQRRALSPEVVEMLKRHDWRGDAAELKGVIRSALTTCGAAETIEPVHLPECVRSAAPSLELVRLPIGTSLEEAERTLIERTLLATRRNKKETARLLGISRSALYAKLQRLEIEL